jgi:hypothetical protein
VRFVGRTEGIILQQEAMLHPVSKTKIYRSDKRIMVDRLKCP